MNVVPRLVRDWYAPRLTAFTLALTPLSALFAASAALRRALYRAGILRTGRLPVPLIVVGNLTAGGSGKTPLVMALGHALIGRGFRPGIVSRGYGRRADPGDKDAPLLVNAADDPLRVGDEPVLLARAGFPVAVARDRVAAARALLNANPECDVVIADDGLQHYAMGRDMEIAVVDASRGFGNGWRLPAGPLREGVHRLRDVDAVVRLVAQDHRDPRDDPGEGVPIEPALPTFRMTLEPQPFRQVGAPDVTTSSSTFAGPGVHAVAGIGNPQRFFDQLAALGIDAIAHAFPDHHRFAAADLAFAGATAVLMTEKDAVKCKTFADERCWYLPVRARIDPALVAHVEEKLRGCQTARDSRLPGHERSAYLRQGSAGADLQIGAARVSDP